MNKKFWRDRRVFVTGATGLVGGWVVKKLIEMEADVVVLIRDFVPSSEFNKANLFSKVTVVSGDIRDRALLERTIAEYEISTVLHLAAQTIVSIANRSPISTFESNISGTWCLLEACRNNPTVTEIVVASSDKAYGDAKALPYKEDTPLLAVYPYDVSKACCDMIAHCYAQTWGLPVVVTRCGNFFGGGDLNWNRIVPGTIRSIFRNESPVIRSDGTLVRDYIYVEDAVSAYMTLAEALSTNRGIIGQAFNFSNEIPLTAEEFVRKIIKTTGSNIEPVILNQASCEIKEQMLDSTKSKELLGWSSNFDMDQALLKTISWYENHFGESK
jgi:CDP-glucose 4,6-dehydratase